MSIVLKKISVLLIMSSLCCNACFGEDFYDMVAKGNVKGVKEVLKFNPKIVDTRYDNGVTPLLVASLNGHSDIVEVLINAGADVDAKDNAGVTPLIAAAYCGHAKTVKKLIEAKASLDMYNKNGATALMAASINRKTTAAKMLISAGADVNRKDVAGMTPIMLAIKNDLPLLTKALLEAKANLNITDNQGNTALLFAIDQTNIDMVRLLLASGANTELKSNISIQAGETKKSLTVTPLICAILKEKIEIVKLLIESKVRINYRDKEFAPLHAALLVKNIEIMKLLLVAGADVNARLKDGSTAFDWAERVDDKKIIDLLAVAKNNQRGQDQDNVEIVVPDSDVEKIKAFINEQDNVKKVQMGHLLYSRFLKEETYSDNNSIPLFKKVVLAFRNSRDDQSMASSLLLKAWDYRRDFEIGKACLGFLVKEKSFDMAVEILKTITSIEKGGTCQKWLDALCQCKADKNCKLGDKIIDDIVANSEKIFKGWESVKIAVVSESERKSIEETRLAKINAEEERQKEIERKAEIERLAKLEKERKEAENERKRKAKEEEAELKNADKNIRILLEAWLKSQKLDEYGSTYWDDPNSPLISKLFAVRKWEILLIRTYGKIGTCKVRIESSTKGGMPIIKVWEISVKLTDQGWKIQMISSD